MTTTLRYKSTDRRGSFEAWGLGFFYRFAAKKKLLNVYVSESKDPVLSFDLHLESSEDAQRFAHYFDRAAQIKALMLSNHETVRLSDTMEFDRLRGVLGNVYALAYHAHELEAGLLRSFIQGSKQRHGFQHFNIKHLCCQSSGEAYYRARLRTQSENETVARSVSMHGLLMTLSEKIVRDLIVVEFSSEYEGAHHLLSFSSQLSTISRILNQNFYPELKIRQRSDDFSAITSQAES